MTTDFELRVMALRAYRDGLESLYAALFTMIDNRTKDRRGAW